MTNNIFDFKIGDATAYLAFYIVIPVFITFISLSVFPSDLISGVYCYVTILVSAFNGIYDGANRWLSGIKSRRNAKLLLVFISNGIVAAYCLYIIFSVLILNNMDRRCDYILLSYGLTCIVAGFDFITSFLKDMTLKKEMGGANI